MQVAAKPPAIAKATVGSELWPAARIDLAQAVWGEGHIAPETIEILPECLPVLGLDPALTTIEIGSGLGAFSREMHLRSGVYMVGYEADPALRQIAVGSALRWGLKRKTRFDVFSPCQPAFGLRPKSVDRVVLHDTLLDTRDKMELVLQIADIMRDGGQLLVADVFLGEDARDERAVKKWRATQGRRRRPVLAEEFCDTLKGAGFDVHVRADATDAYEKTIADAWSNYLERVTAGEFSVKSLGPALGESKMWIATQRAMKTGVLEYRRLTATLRG